MAGPKDISLLFELLGTDERADDVLFTALGNMAHSLDFSAEDKEEVRSALLSLLGPERSRAYVYSLSHWRIPPSREKTCCPRSHLKISCGLLLHVSSS